MKTKEEIKKEVQDAVKEGHVIIGYRESVDFIRTNVPKSVVVANNAPEDKMDEISHNTRASSVEMNIFEGDSKELGLICGKPFPVLVLVIKD